MAVGTYGAVKTLTPRELAETGTQMIVANTFHLCMRPGYRLVQDMGGLQRFSGWDRPILTDSGGYQVYSLAAGARVSEDGVEFRSPVDGTVHRFTPESVVEAQWAFGSDVAMCLDECPAYPAGRMNAETAVVRTTYWARRAKSAAPVGMTLFGIVQGGVYADLRRRSLEELVAMDFPGYAIGGLGIGEPPALARELVELVAGQLPVSKPRYEMGAGYPEDIVRAVASGVDLFDCVLPTRNGRTGTAFTRQGRVVIRNARYVSDTCPIEEGCDCYACRSFSRAYLRHLFLVEEPLGPRMLTLHNIRFFQRLMAEIRSAIADGVFAEWARAFLRQSNDHRGQAPTTRQEQACQRRN